jgi:DNA-binding transcriptional regulator PaaX
VRLGLELSLQFALSMFETFTRQDFALVLIGVRETPSGRQLDRLLDRWRHQQVLHRTGRGAEARFRIADGVKDRIAGSDPAAGWNRRWDGKWRVFSFDMPESRRRDRLRVWRHLRAMRFGFLQRSVWVWPHDVEPLLREMVQADGIPECFCGFEASRLLLCDADEVVESAWDWEQIRRDHAAYLQRKDRADDALRRGCRPAQLARTVQAERDAYLAALRSDPFLPRGLWPESYLGPAVRERHRDVLARMRAHVLEHYRS